MSRKAVRRCCSGGRLKFGAKSRRPSAERCADFPTLRRRMTLDLNVQDLKQISLHGRMVKDGITIVVWRPLIPNVRTDITGNLGEVRFTVNKTQFRPRRPRFEKVRLESMLR